MSKVVDYDAWQKLQLAPLTDFNPAVLQGLKYSQHSGYLLELERLYSTMYLEWPTLKKDASDMTEAVAGLTWTVAPFCQDGAEPDDEAKAVAKTVSDALWMVTAQKPGEFSHCFPELLGAMVHAIYRSVNVHEIVWKFTPELVYPLEYKQLGPQYYMWETRQGEPDRLMLVPDGMDYSRPVTFEPGRFVVALNTTGPDHPMYNADFYSLVGYFVAAKFGLPGLQSFVKRYGHPLRKFTIEDKRRREDLEALADELTQYEIVTASELGGGVVPVDPREREARERAGRLACLLAARADTVIRVFCGIPKVLKGEGK